MIRSFPPLPTVAPSLLSADFGNFRDAVIRLDKAGASWFHFDVMDGTFVPPITFGADLVSAVRKDSDAFFDVHLMIQNPENHIKTFADSGADLISVHYETCPHLHYVIKKIKENNVKSGVVINPATPVSVLHDIIEYVDLVLLMSVNPGWGGQKFINTTYDKLHILRNLLENKNSKAVVQVDGGVNIENINNLARSGVKNIVAGSAIYSTPNPEQSFRDLTAKLKVIISA